MEQSKYLFLMIAMCAGLISVAQKVPVNVAKGLQVEIQTSAICEMCQHTIEYDLTFAKGIKSADLNLENKIVTVVYNPNKISAHEVRKRITKVGYHADSLRRDPVAYDNLPSCCKAGGHDDP